MGRGTVLRREGFLAIEGKLLLVAFADDFDFEDMAVLSFAKRVEIDASSSKILPTFDKISVFPSFVPMDIDMSSDAVGAMPPKI